MFFTSHSYYLFLPLTFAVFRLLPDRRRWLVLLFASYFFYATFRAPHLLLVLAAVTLLSYGCGLALGRTRDERRRKGWFWLGATGCLLILAVVKYLLPLVLGHAARAHATLLVSIGISYFIFQAISYLADIYLEIQEPEAHLGHYALFMAFFPRLLQGPIERAGNLLPQLKKDYAFEYAAMRSGLLLFAWGLFKKIVIADRLALYANDVFGNVHGYSGLPLLFGIYAYAGQIYFDFSGYTDMARASARLFGIDLTENFNHPYQATSVADFWRRWHMSFSRWILDYIFKPIQMAWRDYGQTGTALALLVTFLASGLWHGMTWGFIVWGLLHGMFLASAVYYRPYQKKLHAALRLQKGPGLKTWQVFVTFQLVSFAWIFFRARTLREALYVVSHLFRGGHGSLSGLVFAHGSYELLVAGLALAVAAGCRGFGPVNGLFARPAWVRWPAYGFLLAALVLFRVGELTNFVYIGF